MNKTELFEVAIPKKTSTYQPISHANIYNQTMEQLDKAGLTVSNEKIVTNGKGTQLINKLTIEYPGYKYMQMELAYRNSYDKSMSVGMVAGSSIFVCSNGQMNGEMNFMKRHMGSVVLDLQQAIIDTINQLESNFLLLNKHNLRMQEIEVNPQATAELIGRMYVQENLVTPTQLSIIKAEVEKPSYVEFTDPTVWSLYNHTTQALKKSSPMNYIKQHIELHSFMEKEFSL